MSDKSFTITLEMDVSLTAEEVWPDDDAPEDPTAEDVLAVMKGKGHGKLDAVDAFNLEESVSLHVVSDEDDDDHADW